MTINTCKAPSTVPGTEKGLGDRELLLSFMVHLSSYLYNKYRKGGEGRSRQREQRMCAMRWAMWRLNSDARLLPSLAPFSPSVKGDSKQFLWGFPGSEALSTERLALSKSLGT